MKNYKELLKDISTLVFDIDGVMTNGKVTVFPDGNMIREVNMRDGYAIKRAIDQGLRIIIISGGTSEAMRYRFEKLGLKKENIILGTLEKLEKLEEFIVMYGLKKENMMYMGDDMPDIPPLKLVGLSTCPNDAIPEVKEICNYISPYKGGDGAVRDIVEQILKIQNLW